MVRVTVIGSGDAYGSGGRGHSGYLIEAPGATFLLDAGPTVLQGLKRHGFGPECIDFVVLSHLHGDHFGGVPFLFLDYIYDSRRRRPFRIYGPADTERRVRQLFSALFERIAEQPLPFPVDYHELAAGAPCTVDGLRLVPVLVPHATELVCFAYRIEAAGRTIFYSGDTGWTEELVRNAHGADLFLCECSLYGDGPPIHLSYPQIAARARDFGCARLVLTHLGREPLARRGEITLECAEDGMMIEL